MYSTAWSLQKASHKDNIFQRTKNISFYQNTVVDFFDNCQVFQSIQQKRNVYKGFISYNLNFEPK